MSDYDEMYRQLNDAQRQAVDAIDGPLLVIAGPGTGKTQLLSARVANILRQTDATPDNILCLTFTESGAENMRRRLARFIGQAAYNVTISTYHGLGRDIIYRFPQYFTETQLQNPIDELGKHQILTRIIDGLSYSSPLKQVRHHLGDLISTISEVKRALLTPDALRKIALDNQQFTQQLSQRAHEPLAALSQQARLSSKSLPMFEQLLSTAEQLVPQVHDGPFPSLATMATESLQTALGQANDTGKTTPITAWKNKWLAKDANNIYICSGALENQRIAVLADVLEAYQNALAANGQFDFDDMIIRVIHALEKAPELKYSLQEQYQYILLDEFQDTNAAQLRIVELLTDNPVHEGRPNVMAVGDDDQAIYAFQGAEVSNMLDFYRMYREVTVINLTQNYRSHQNILHVASGIANQIDSRLEHSLEGLQKELVAAGTFTTQPQIVRREHVSDVAQYDWIASHIRQLIDSGTDPNEIAVLAPKHRYLEPLVAHLNERGIPVQYDKRENILESPIIKQLLTMSKLVLALHHNNHALADHLWPEVLSYDFWSLPIRHIWQIAWQVNDSRGETNWTRALMDTEAMTTPALLFATLAHKVSAESCEAMLDYLIGSAPLATNEPDVPSVLSPLRAYYTSTTIQQSRPELFYQVVTELKVLQTKLREHQSAQGRLLGLTDLMDFIAMYEAAGERMLNTSPHHQQQNAVQLMTVFKAKGLEFEHVFLPCCHDDVWGGSSRGSKNNLTLPANLSPIRHAGATDDERLRILFVAITRAKIGLHLTSYSHSYSGGLTKRLKYLAEQEQPDGGIVSTLLPEGARTIVMDTSTIPALDIIELNWRNRHIEQFSESDLRSLLQQRLANYQLSPTHLNQFTDLVHNGPQEFMFKTLLRFPQAPSSSGQYGNAIHQTLERVQYYVAEHNAPPPLKTALNWYYEYLHHTHMPAQEMTLLAERGAAALKAWYPQRKQIFTANDKAEVNFKREGVFIGEAHLTGKIDRLEIDHDTKSIVIVDYKTGRAHSKWAASELSLHKYRQQLYCYKLLVEGSSTYKNYHVAGARLEYIEPTPDGRLLTLDLHYDAKETERIRQLITAVWQRVQALSFDLGAQYTPDLKGTITFEEALITQPTDQSAKQGL